MQQNVAALQNRPPHVCRFNSQISDSLWRDPEIQIPSQEQNKDKREAKVWPEESERRFQTTDVGRRQL